MVQIPDSHIDLLDRPVVVTLVTVMPDGQPQATPIWADQKDGVIRVNTEAGRQKYKNLTERPMATVLAIDPENPYRWMEVRGKVVYESEGDERSLIEKLSHDYVGQPYQNHSDADRRVTFHIQPERIVTAG
jgi:PPOX class probable F420-dependent enzyme